MGITEATQPPYLLERAGKKRRSRYEAKTLGKMDQSKWPVSSGWLGRPEEYREAEREGLRDRSMRFQHWWWEKRY